ncbi:V-type ATP synthase subunit D [Candidatus Micrarchaeota archaeon]|nr:V-type ATP synthase subunit D [Candidatus Micrarchaeota archaeon]MBU2477141.1 V-type ATP synthase subunit D [Candidatus Micrarchaeota archaeon]
MLSIKPTRSELIKLNKGIKLATSGHALLKRKRDGLIKEFFSVLEEAKKSKSEMTDNFKKAKQEITLARAVDGTISVKSASLALKYKADIDVKTRNVMGVVVPAVKSDYNVKSFEERGYGLIGTSSYIDDAAESYEILLKNIIVAAEIENTLRKLLTEIDKTKRRVNALEFKVIPEMKKSAAFIRLRLEEMERDDLFRLKKIKSKSKKKAALKEQEAS